MLCWCIGIFVLAGTALKAAMFSTGEEAKTEEEYQLTGDNSTEVVKEP